MFKEELIIVRHARSRHNIKKSQDLDDSLSDFGFKQANNTGSYFKEKFDFSGHKFYPVFAA